MLACIRKGVHAQVQKGFICKDHERELSLVRFDYSNRQEAFNAVCRKDYAKEESKWEIE